MGSWYGRNLAGGRKAPFPPNNDVIAEARNVRLCRALAGVERDSTPVENLLADLLVVIQVGPT
jgi:hypothetical protein